MRERDLAIEAELAKRLLRRELVRRVGVGVQIRDGDGRHALLAEDLERLRDVVLDEGAVHDAVGAYALGDRQTQPARNERRGRLPEEAVGIAAIAASHLEHVAEAACREQADGGTGTREERVQPGGHAVEEVRGRADELVGYPCVDGAHNALLGRGRRGWFLRHPDLARLIVVEDDVGERSADVDADACRHFERLLPIVCARRRGRCVSSNLTGFRLTIAVARCSTV